MLGNRLAEGCEALLIHIVVHVVLDHFLEGIKSLYAARNNSLWCLEGCEELLTELSRLCSLCQVRKDLLHNVGNDVAVLVLA